jgi:hypothetical protein
MDVEEQPRSNLDPNSCKRLGDDYVFQIVPKYGSCCFFPPYYDLIFLVTVVFARENLGKEEKKILDGSFPLGSWVLAMRLNFCAFPTLSREPNG